MRRHLGLVARSIRPGCRFHPRCPLAIDLCRAVAPEFETKAGRRVACHVVTQR